MRTVTAPRIVLSLLAFAAVATLVEMLVSTAAWADDEPGFVLTLFSAMSAYAACAFAPLIYPALVTIVALSVIAVLLVYVVPQVVSVYEQSRQTLPWLTRERNAFAHQRCGVACRLRERAHAHARRELQEQTV